jgi:hypothetical protein
MGRNKKTSDQVFKKTGLLPSSDGSNSEHEKSKINNRDPSFTFMTIIIHLRMMISLMKIV